jgi:hypothetical protein
MKQNLYKKKDLNMTAIKNCNKSVVISKRNELLTKYMLYIDRKTFNK